MRKVWSMSTTVRNPKRIPGFLKVLNELEGEIWGKSIQNKYQILLIKNRVYIPDSYHPLLSKANLSFDEAEKIFNDIGYVAKSMRGRTSFKPLEKLKFVKIGDNNIITIKKVGKGLLNGKLTFTEAMTNQLPIWKFENDNNCIRPYIETIKFIFELDKLYEIKGITRKEFEYFVMTINTIEDRKIFLEYIVKLRNKEFNLNDVINVLEKQYSNFYSIKDYSDNNIRYLVESELINYENNRIVLNYTKIKDIEDLIEKY